MPAAAFPLRIVSGYAGLYLLFLFPEIIHGKKSPAGRGRRSVPHPAGLLNVSMVLFIFLYFYSRRRYAHSCIFIS